MLVARVAVLVARVTVTHYECLEFPVDGANVRNAVKSGQGGDDPLDPCLILPSDFMLRARSSPRTLLPSGVVFLGLGKF